MQVWVATGPDPAPDGVVRWCKDGGVRWRKDLRRRIVERFGVQLPERTVGKYLAMLGYRRLSVHPPHPKHPPHLKSDPEAQALFK